MEKTPVSRTKKCVLKCNEPTKLFDLPSEDAIRALWLYQLCLDKYDKSVQVCDRHFSQIDLSEITIPDRNLPKNKERKEYYENQIKMIRSTEVKDKEIILRLISDESVVNRKEVNPRPNSQAGASGNKKQPAVGYVTQSARDFDHTLIGEEKGPPNNANAKSVNHTSSAIIDDELDPISEFMRIASDEPPSKMFELITKTITENANTAEADQSHSASKDKTLSVNETFEEDPQSTKDMTEEAEFAPKIIEETRELTEKELDMIIVEDPQLDRPPNVIIESQVILPSTYVPPTSSGNLPSTSSETVAPAKPQSPPRGTDKLINDTSTFLLDYELRIQGKYMCDVIEIPEYILMFTIPKAKETRPDIQLANNNEFVNGKKRSLLDIPPSITISRTLEEESNENCESDVQQAEEIDYVYYMGEGENPRRDREIQVDIEITTKDSANQCDVELDVNMIPISREPKLLNRADFSKRECLVCGEILLNYLAQVKHFALHGSESKCLCSYCGATLANPEKLIAHENYFHVGFVMKIKEPVRCPRLFCQKAFYSKKALNNHIDEHIGNVEHKCYICNRVFTSSCQVFRHQKLSNLCMRRKMLKQRMFFRRMLDC